jgi:phage terminase large subunit GpA-like protein
MRTEIERLIIEQTRNLFFATQPTVRLKSTGNPAVWAVRKRWLAQSESPLTTEQAAKFNFDAAPWTEEPSAQATNEDVQTMVLWMGSNMAKTSILQNVIGYSIDEKPCGIIYALKTEDQMKEISQEKIAPMIEATPSLNSKIMKAGSRYSTNSLFYKKFTGGFLAMIGTGSVTGFRAHRAGVVLGDEIDSWDDDVGGEGDPVELLLRRADGFPESMRILSSTGTIKGKSRIEKWYGRSDQRKWFIPCRKCGCFQLLTWRQIRWPKGEPDKAMWFCEACDAEHEDRHRRRAISDGEWRPTAPFNGIRGYWIPGMYSLMPPNQGYVNRTAQFAREHIEAKAGGRQVLTVRTQTFFAETTQEEEDAKADFKVLYDRREDYFKDGQLPNEIIVIAAGSDVQSDRIEVEFEGFGRGEQSWGVEHCVLWGDPRQEEIWGRLEGLLLRKWVRADGCVLGLRCFGLDTGYPAAIRQAYEFIRPRQSRNWFALKGSSVLDAPFVQRPKKSKVDRVTLLSVGTHKIKGLLYDNATIIDPETPGYMHFPCVVGKEGGRSEFAGYTEDWFKQLLAEGSMPVFRNGKKLREFFMPTGVKRNEALDMRVYTRAAMFALGPLDWDREEKLLLKTRPDAEPEEEYVEIQSAGSMWGGAPSGW